MGIRGDLALREGRYDDAVQWLEECGCDHGDDAGHRPQRQSVLAGVGARGRAADHDDARAALVSASELADLERWYARPVILAAAAALLDGDEAGIDAAIAGAATHMPFDIALMRTLGCRDRRRTGAGALAARGARHLRSSSARPIAADRARRLLREAGGPVPRRRRAARRRCRTRSPTRA